MNRLAFGGFELDDTSGDLWKAGESVHIQEQPLRLLLCLLERPGQLVSREELQKRVWPGGIHVGFEDGLNAAAWRLRQVLGDSSERPRFIETVPRKGYRFVGQVSPCPERRAAAPVAPAAVAPAGTPPPGTPHPWRRLRVAVALGAAAALGLSGAWLAFRSPAPSVAVAPLQNETGEAAVDYFAEALTRQVSQDLAARPRLRLLPAPGTTAPGVRTAPGEPGLVLHWTLTREADHYRLRLRLAGPRGHFEGEQLFHSRPEEFRDLHSRVASFVVSGLEGPQ